MSVTSTTPEKLVQAIGLLYEGNMQAKDWLLALMKTPLSWSLPAQVLRSSSLPSPDVTFYCANMLSTKVQSSWTALPSTAKDQTLQLLWRCLQRDPPFHKLTLERITIALARVLCQPWQMAPKTALLFQRGATALAKMPTATAVSQVLLEALHLARTDTRKNGLSAVAILKSLATEVEAVPITATQRKALESELKSHRDNVSNFLLFIAGAAAKVKDGVILTAVFSTAKGWVAYGLDLAYLMVRQSNFLKAGFSLLANGIGGTNNAQLCVSIVGFVERALELDSRRSVSQLTDTQRNSVLSALIQAVNSTKERFLVAYRAGPDNDNESKVSVALTKLCSVVVEAFSSYICLGTHAGSIQIIQYLLTQSQNSIRNTAAITIEAWTCIQDVPLSKRCPHLREPLLQSIFNVLLMQCTHADGRQDEDEEDSIAAPFRIGPAGCADLMGSLVNTIPAYTLDKLIHVFRTGLIKSSPAASAQSSTSAWIYREVALFVMEKIASECPPEAADKCVCSFLEVLRQQPNLMTTSARLTETICKFIGAYSKKVLRKPTHGTALVFCIQCFEFALLGGRKIGKRVPIVAAESLARTCHSCKKVLSTAGYLQKLIDIADKATEAGLEINGRVALAKAISTLVSSYASTLLTNDADESKRVAEIIEKCASKQCGRLQQFMTEASKRSKDQQQLLHFTKAVAAELECLQSLVRWLQFPQCTRGGIPVSHPLRHVLGKLWPTLEVLPTHFLDSRIVMRELCGLYYVIFLALQKDTMPILPRMFTNAIDIYCKHGLSQCLKTVSMAFEQFGEMPKVQQLFHDGLKRVSEVTFSWVTAKNSKFMEDPELAEYFFDPLMFHALLFCPAAILLNPVLSHVFKLAILVADTDEATSSCASLRFLTLLLNKPGRSKHKRSSTPLAVSLSTEAHKRVTECIRTHGQHLIRVVLQGIAGRTNERGWRSLANIVWHLTTEYPGPILQWLKEGYFSPIFESVPMFTDAAKINVLKAIQAYTRTNSSHSLRMLRLLIKDVCKFCRSLADIQDIMSHPTP